ncbi:MAG: cytochrome-c peroxidase [Flavobacteriales bacterium]
MNKPLIILFSVVAVFALQCKKGFDNENNCVDVGSATPYELDIPPFFPQMDIPADNPLTVEGIDLGRHLFWEKKLSEDNTLSCGGCHFPEHAFSDPAQFSIGTQGLPGPRHTMPLFNLGWAQDYFWDGRALTLEEQILEPIPHPLEMNQSWPDAIAKLNEDNFYPNKFRDAFGGTEITKEKVAKAIAQFLRTMISAGSDYDKYRLGQYDLTPLEELGLDLFVREGGDTANVNDGQGGADCFHCHGFGNMQFTDFLPHNNGLDSVFTDLGYGGISGNPIEMGLFKTPSLRNLAYTAPYMHDGRFQTLDEVIDHYDSGGVPSTTIDPFMKYTTGGLTLSDLEKQALKAFLMTLTDEEFITNPDFMDPH